VWVELDERVDRGSVNGESSTMRAEAHFNYSAYAALKRRSSTLMRGHFSTLRYLFDGQCFILDSVPHGTACVGKTLTCRQGRIIP
jgi:hypothetical protein